MEIFKESKLSICNKCINIDMVCVNKVFMVCDRDDKIEKSFVKTCNKFNKDFTFNINNHSKTVAALRPESRIEMMGGGFVGSKYDKNSDD